MKRISKEEFTKLLAEHPNHTSHTIMFCSPFQTFYWKDEGKNGEDRSFGKGAFLMRRHSNGAAPVEYEPESYFSMADGT